MFQLPELGYDYNALEPHLSEEIMRLHHDSHHRAYVDKLNAAIEGRAEYAGWRVEDFLIRLEELPEDIRQTVRNNGGGHYNHSLFWKWMSPVGGGEPSGPLAEAIKVRYGSFQAFVDEFTTQATKVFGSGWVWLQPNMDIITTPLQDSPITKGAGPEPILGLDVWEHAYYLEYKNHRDAYVKAWWNIVNWKTAEERYQSTV